MRAIDDVVLARLRVALPPSSTGEDRVHDSYVRPDDPEGKVISAALPYLVYYSSLGFDTNPRASGRKGRRDMFFQVSYVGATRAQAKAAGERQRAQLADRALTIPGRRSWLCTLDESQRIRRDDDAARPDGTPLFYGVDLYTIAVTRQPNE